ncbi:hypothetical protein CONPUDRAFT_154080 [Coniophora puteana RWD-64-598 SS2]|uniref:Uncharacterized protein n=1 Tax=Coniophora puteana (strain RWD-64-598) TaxID=741705 RepID=A0A5M3MSA4_CONPW|nr:uncharacterized protein CONPUDRAFT_154080 [Coniophora puteana RWD-64-598 SS2]EIW81545.1 hypothetical protein CONPUDRAFT_154080 [Coniophora puteana RWD-64-598 SS2]
MDLEKLSQAGAATQLRLPRSGYAGSRRRQRHASGRAISATTSCQRTGHFSDNVVPADVRGRHDNTVSADGRRADDTQDVNVWAARRRRVQEDSERCGASCPRTAPTTKIDCNQHSETD